MENECGEKEEEDTDSEPLSKRMIAMAMKTYQIEEKGKLVTKEKKESPNSMVVKIKMKARKETVKGHDLAKDNNK